MRSSPTSLRVVALSRWLRRPERARSRSGCGNNTRSITCAGVFALVSASFERKRNKGTGGENLEIKRRAGHARNRQKSRTKMGVAKRFANEEIRACSRSTHLL